MTSELFHSSMQLARSVATPAALINCVRTSAYIPGAYIRTLTCGRSIGRRNIHENKVPRSSTDVQSVDGIKEDPD